MADPIARSVSQRLSSSMEPTDGLGVTTDMLCHKLGSETMDRQNIIILIAAAVIVILGAIYYLGYVGNQTVAPTTPPPATTN